MDGIYYRDEVQVGPLFSEKEQKSLKHSMYSDSYLPDYGLTEFNMGGDDRENNKYEIHSGAGRAGKTHNNLIHKGLVNPLFIKVLNNGLCSSCVFHEFEGCSWDCENIKVKILFIIVFTFICLCIYLNAYKSIYYL